MTPIQMALECVKAMTEVGTLGVTLTIEKGKTPLGFPHGELLNEMRRNGRIECTRSYDPEKILRWLARNDLIKFRRDGNNIILEKMKIEKNADA